ncbi:MAG: gamma carbonic anhydrase family protein [Lachnospiraceae bacterium]|nr:gamma carbonic anhydrase family protein [Lachnospiraceae bacterium]MBQ1640335.1 gamma carbonic anhydrase family protein [Lachnospiraceae bacterium]MBQ2317867.1 gamma carbonic anhydrase family protein [Lachnospiraceae bacterium]MBQ2532335.1 gamma carbonic anhydrase family protein [Lachnospiraceae bacterium]MBQ2578833.1 gamma carbonic anhydrase family protein [Lachnospiraceae bacterium]
MKLADSVYVAKGAIITGDVTVGEHVGVWYNAVIRGDEYPITIGDDSNIQDCAVVHVGNGFACNIGKRVTVGHGAIVHGCTVGDDSMIGMGAIVLNGAKIGKGCLIAAGALVTEGMEVPDGMLVIGVPGKVVKPVPENQTEYMKSNAQIYVDEAIKQKANPSEVAKES